MQEKPPPANQKRQNSQMTNVLLPTSVASYCLALNIEEPRDFCGRHLLLNYAFALKRKRSPNKTSLFFFSYNCRACLLVMSGWGKSNFH